jgi:hypothetical protein
MRGLPFAFWKKGGIIYDIDALEFIQNWELNTGVEMQLRQRLAVNDWYRGMKGEGTPNGNDLFTLVAANSARIFILVPLDNVNANANAYMLDAVSNGIVKGDYVNMAAGDFTAYGVTGGTSKYFSVQTNLPSTLTQFGTAAYCTSNLQSTFIWGVNGNSANGACLLNPRNQTTGDIAYYIRTNVQTLVSRGDSRGFFQNQIVSGVRELYIDGTFFHSTTTTNQNNSTLNFMFHARNDRGTPVSSTQTLANYSYRLPSMTANEVEDYYTVVQRLQSNVIAGGRQIGTAIPPI